MLPLFPVTRYTRPQKGDLVLTGKDWSKEIDPDAKGILVSAQTLFCPFLGGLTPVPSSDYEPEIQALSTTVIDRASMDEIDQALRLYFDL